MEYSIKDFETSLNVMNVYIENIRKENNKVVSVTGIMNDIRCRWDAAGSCFAAQERVPEFDIQFYTISEDERRIDTRNEIYQFIRNGDCLDCALRIPCHGCNNMTIVFPCSFETRKDQIPGNFKRYK